MTDQNENVKKDPLKVANPGKLQLTKTVESGKVKQNFTHGRSKTVTVEVRKTRTFAQGATGGMVEVKQQPANAIQAAVLEHTQHHDDESMRHLTTEEKQVRLKAFKIAEEEMKKAAERAALLREEELKNAPVEEESPPTPAPEAPVAAEKEPVIDIAAVQVRVDPERKPSIVTAPKLLSKAHHPAVDDHFSDPRLFCHARTFRTGFRADIT